MIKKSLKVKVNGRTYEIEDPEFYAKRINRGVLKEEDTYDNIVKRMNSEWTGEKGKLCIGFIPLFKKNKAYLDKFGVETVDKNIIYEKTEEADDIIKELYVYMSLNRFVNNEDTYNECSKSIDEKWGDLTSKNELRIKMLFFNEGSQLFDILCPFITTFDKFKSFYDDKIKDISELILIGYNGSIHTKVKAAENIFNTYRDTYVDAVSHFWDVCVDAKAKKKISKYIDRDDINGINKSKEVASMNDNNRGFRTFEAAWADAVREIASKPAGGKISEISCGKSVFGERSIDEISKYVDDQHFRWRYGETEINPINIRFGFDEVLRIENNEVTIKNAFMGINSVITFRKHMKSDDLVISYFNINKIMFARFKTVQTRFVKHMCDRMFGMDVSFIFVLDRDNFVDDIIIKMENCRWSEFISGTNNIIEMSFKESDFDRNPFMSIANNIIDMFATNTKDIDNIKIASASSMASKFDVNYGLDSIFISAHDLKLLGDDIVEFPMNVNLIRGKEFTSKINIAVMPLYHNQLSDEVIPCKYVNNEKGENMYCIGLGDILKAMDLVNVAHVLNFILRYDGISLNPTISLIHGPSIIYNTYLCSKRYTFNNDEELLKCVMEILFTKDTVKDYINAYNVELHKASVSMNINKHNKFLDNYEF